MGIIHLHLRKMPLKYRGMIPSRSGPWWLPSGGHHGLGVLQNWWELVLRYSYVGIGMIDYSSHKTNSTTMVESVAGLAAWL